MGNHSMHFSKWKKPIWKCHKKSEFYNLALWCRWMLSCAPLCLRLWGPMDCACQVPLSVRFPRKGHWSVWPFLLSRDLAGDPHPRIEPTSPRSPTLAAGLITTEPPENPFRNVDEIKMVSGCHGVQSRGYEYHEFRTMKSSCETVVMDTSYYTFAQTLE